MQIILMEKVVNLGNLGDVVKVKDGFARNFLIPQGKAKRATAANLKEFEGRRADLEKKANEALSKKFDIEAFPTVVVLSPEGKQLSKDTGYDGSSAKSFVAKLEKFTKK